MDIEILQGRTRRYFIGPLVEPDGETTNLVSMAIRFMVKATMPLADDQAVINHTVVLDETGDIVSGTGFAVGGTHPVTRQVYTGPASGVLTLTLEDEDSESVTPGPYLWEMVVMRDGDVDQMRAGNATVIDTLIHTPEVV